MTAEQERWQEAVTEAVLFTMGRSVETAQLAAALECTAEEADAAAKRLQIEYALPFRTSRPKRYAKPSRHSPARYTATMILLRSSRQSRQEVHRLSAY